MRISDWSSDVCSSDLAAARPVCWAALVVLVGAGIALTGPSSSGVEAFYGLYRADAFSAYAKVLIYAAAGIAILMAPRFFERTGGDNLRPEYPVLILLAAVGMRSEEHTSELQSLMRISYAVFCLKKNKNTYMKHTEYNKQHNH